jgi:hypothetical protein
MLGQSPAIKSPSKHKSAKRGRGRPPKRPEEKSDAAQVNVAFFARIVAGHGRMDCRATR